MKKEKEIKDKGIIVHYKDVRNMGPVVLIDEKILKYLEGMNLEK